MPLLRFPPYRQRAGLNPANWWVFISLFSRSKSMLAI
jgi:hypothetical protein